MVFEVVIATLLFIIAKNKKCSKLLKEILVFYNWINTKCFINKYLLNISNDHETFQ